jgi:hypothetical protein
MIMKEEKFRKIGIPEIDYLSLMAVKYKSQ